MATVFEAMTALADAIRAKSGVSGALSIEQMTAAVNAISAGGGGEPTLNGSKVISSVKIVEVEGVQSVTIDSGILCDVFALFMFPLAQPKIQINRVTAFWQINYTGVGFNTNSSEVSALYKFPSSSSSLPSVGLGTTGTSGTVVYTTETSEITVGATSSSYTWQNVDKNGDPLKYLFVVVGLEPASE